MRTPIGIVLSVLTATAASAQIDPPDGPVGPTFKTLDQVEPSTPVGPDTTPGDAGSVYRITAPGAYHLTGNIRVAAPGKHIIEIATSAVTLDLRGYQVKADSHDTLSVIRATGGRRIRVMNGVVEPLSNADGVDLEGCSNCTVENIDASYGLRSIDAGARAVVRGCTVERALETGIYAGDGSLIEGCTLWDSPYADADAIETGAACIVRDTAIEHWDGNGILAGMNTRIADCTIRDADHAGIFVEVGALITGCTISGGDGWGIYALALAQIEGCTISWCGYDGIRAYSDCRIIGNSCDYNGRATGELHRGIYLLSDGNTVTDNSCRNNDGWGIYVAGSGNTVFRNHATGNDDDFHVLAPNQNFWGGEVKPGGDMTNPNANYSDF